MITFISTALFVYKFVRCNIFTNIVKIKDMLFTTNIINIVNSHQVHISPNLLLLCNVSGIANWTTRCCTIGFTNIVMKSCKTQYWPCTVTDMIVKTLLHLLLKIVYSFLLQVPLLDPLGSTLTGYLLEYHVYDNTSTIKLPALNTSYTLYSVASGAVYNITVSALSDVGPSRNNPSVQFGEFNLPNCSFFTYFLISLHAAVPLLLCLATPEG